MNLQYDQHVEAARALLALGKTDYAAGVLADLQQQIREASRAENTRSTHQIELPASAPVAKAKEVQVDQPKTYIKLCEIRKDNFRYTSSKEWKGKLLEMLPHFPMYFGGNSLVELVQGLYAKQVFKPTWQSGDTLFIEQKGKSRRLVWTVLALDALEKLSDGDVLLKTSLRSYLNTLSAEYKELERQKAVEKLLGGGRSDNN